MTAIEDHALRVIVDERIRELLKVRTWYRVNRWAAWTDLRRENEVELRALLRLRRNARNLARVAVAA